MKKFLIYIFIGIILSGVFVIPENVSAQAATDPGTCTTTDKTDRATAPVVRKTTRGDCAELNTSVLRQVFTPDSGGPSVNAGVPCTGPNTPVGCDPAALDQDTRDALQKEIERNTCGVIMEGSLGGCLVALFYYIFNGLAGFLLTFSALFLDIMIPISLSSSMYGGEFIGKAWVVVRDISNIFFILILIYIAIQTVLDIGHGTKKMIAQVIIMALLINFSMFFSKVVIDSSNILALIFYNNISTKTETKNGATEDIQYVPKLNSAKAIQDKDVAGVLADKFNLGKLLGSDFFDKLRKTTVDFSPGIANSFSAYAAAAGTGLLVGSGPLGWTALAVGGVAYAITSASAFVPIPIMLGVITATGLVMLFAAYAFFIAAWSFLGRLMELWLLIIFSPFAFVSWAIPELKKTPYAGWDDWSKRLISASFMAPIFMFFMYLIILIIEKNPIGSLAAIPEKDQHWITYLLFIIIPSLLVMGLLLQAAKQAQKGAGQLGEMAVGFGKVLGGLALGGGIGLAASGLQGSLGHLGKKIYENKDLAKAEEGGNKFAAKLRSWAGGDDGKGGFAGSSFDARRGVLGGGLKLVSSATGLNLGTESKFMMKEAGGYVADLERRENIRVKRAEGLKKAASGHETEELHHLEVERLAFGMKNEEELRILNDKLESAKNKREQYRGREGFETQFAAASSEYDEILNQKKKISGGKKGKEVVDEQGNKTMVYYTTNGYISKAEYTGAQKAENEARENQKKLEESLTQAGNARMAAQVDARNAALKRAEAKARLDRGDRENPELIAAFEDAARTEKEANKKLETAVKNFAQAQKGKKYADSILEKAKINMQDAEVDYRKMRADGKNFGRSLSEFDDELIPEAKHKVKKAEHDSAWNFASTLERNARFYEKDAVHESAHKIRMGAKPEKHGADHHHGVGDEILASVIAESLVGNRGGDHPPADGGHAPAGGGEHPH